MKDIETMTDEELVAEYKNWVGEWRSQAFAEGPDYNSSKRYEAEHKCDELGDELDKRDIHKAEFYMHNCLFEEYFKWTIQDGYICAKYIDWRSV